MLFKNWFFSQTSGWLPQAGTRTIIFYESQPLLQHFWKQQSSCFSSSGSDSNMKSTCKVKCGPIFYHSDNQRGSGGEVILHLCEVFQERISGFHSRGIKARLAAHCCASREGNSDVGRKSGKQLFYLKLLWVLWHLKPFSSFPCLSALMWEGWTPISQVSKHRVFFVVVDDATQNVYFIDQSFH